MDVNYRLAAQKDYEGENRKGKKREIEANLRQTALAVTRCKGCLRKRKTSNKISFGSIALTVRESGCDAGLDIKVDVGGGTRVGVDDDEELVEAGEGTEREVDVEGKFLMDEIEVVRVEEGMPFMEGLVEDLEGLVESL